MSKFYTRNSASKALASSSNTSGLRSSTESKQNFAYDTESIMTNDSAPVKAKAKLEYKPQPLSKYLQNAMTQWS
ncbi:hypothetical protein SAPIO_CDS5723 [Scedosporium apiospermum]|uniref:Uncharacterized protein n=1 Tax=Pseudallescheria apiosperma TaxID=563466 RepID=A0A084G596_PSEDA|nr:uncharacterized protein SAPIO_CDS5723 [Scedosporium apiospermum]KEZ42508.1 hypothetical protein SAPIO_CDS5723 [Scedosporium apiospermum]